MAGHMTQASSHITNQESSRVVIFDHNILIIVVDFKEDMNNIIWFSFILLGSDLECHTK